MNKNFEFNYLFYVFQNITNETRFIGFRNIIASNLVKIAYYLQLLTALCVAFVCFHFCLI